jgi:hypothetical protein
MDTAKTSSAEVETEATIYRPEKVAHLDIIDSNLYSASTLHLYGCPTTTTPSSPSIRQQHAVSAVHL